MHKGTVFRSYKIDDEQCNDLSSYISDFSEKNSGTPKGYNLINKQCAFFAYGCVKSAGVNDIVKPWDIWVTPKKLHKRISKKIEEK